MPGAGGREVFWSDEEAIARSLVIQLVQAGLGFDDPPTILDQTENSRFMGGIAFHDEWMLVESNVAGGSR